MNRKRQLPVAPYLPFKTFINALEHLSHGTFDPIDRTAFPSFSGTLVAQMIGALRFLELIDDQGYRRPDLETILIPDRQRAKLKDLLESHYEFVVRDLHGMTLPHLTGALRAYHVNGETAEKARAFFLNAAKYAGLPLPPQLDKKKPSTRRTPEALNQRERVSGLGHRRSVEQNQTPIPTRTVELKSGGRITLSIDEGLFELAPEDREFVFKLIDHFNSRVVKKEKTRERESAQLEFAEPDTGPWR